MQTRLGSLAESCVNVAIGYIIAILSQLAIFPMFGVDVSFSANLQISAWFTAVSIIRSYAVRRLFNRRSRQ
ncbi:MAG TPA: hypothetical protein DD713_10160 [Nitrospiraceae bacterium]|nr:hypothetical protein [Nitrospiraceae bacterium]